MAIKFETSHKSMNPIARFHYLNVASEFLNVFILETPEAREAKRREKVRCELVQAQFGQNPKSEDRVLIGRIGQLLKLD